MKNQLFRSTFITLLTYGVYCFVPINIQADNLSTLDLNSEVVKGFWEENADKWIDHIHRSTFKSHVNAPAFLDMLPEVRDKKGLELGCGTGDMTFQVAEKGAQMTGTDICTKFVKFCQEQKEISPSITFEVADATDMPQYQDASFDFVISVHCMMDIQECGRAMEEIGRVVKKGGFFLFSLPHPVIWDKQMDWEMDREGNQIALKIPVNGYTAECRSEVNEWMFQGADTTDKFKTPFFKRSLSEWTHLIKQGGFLIESIEEPRALPSLIKGHPDLLGADKFPYSIIFLCRKI